MAKASLADDTSPRGSDPDWDPDNVGPFVTISRQFGCYGFSLGLLLLEILNEDAEPDETWQIYQKDILARLSSETDMAAEILDQQRRSRPRMIADFFRSLSSEAVPSGQEVRKKTSAIIKGVAIDGHAIIVGQGGTIATRGLPNGLSVRLEAPEAWRVKQTAFRDSLSETEAKKVVQNDQQQRDYLRKIYERKFPGGPRFQLVYDCSAFTLAQIARHVAQMMRIKGYV